MSKSFLSYLESFKLHPISMLVFHNHDTQMYKKISNGM